VYCLHRAEKLTHGVRYMPLDDKEQRILEEIERQFYEEDPDLARAVKRIEKPSRIGMKLSILGVIAGLAVVIVYVAVNTWIAVAGFALLVASATSLVNALRARDWRRTVQEASEELPE
jgi:Flp pilus assembly protein TadB